jgi:hypothetical protein
VNHERVFVSAATAKCPGVAEVADLAEVVTGRRPVPLERVRFGADELLLGEEIELDRESPFYPTRSNEKVMRKEVVAATIAVSELVDRASILPAARAEMPLFVASGMSMERQTGDLDWFSGALRAVRESAAASERNRSLGQLTPPLLALRTLTNAATSFIAERARVAGNNSTFGSTSLSGFHALQEAFDAVRDGSCPMALAGGASRGGIPSYFVHRNFCPDTGGWRESVAVVFLLLESGTSLQERGASALCELIELRSGGIPRVTGRIDSVPFARFSARGADGALAVYSGAFRRSEFEALRSAVAAAWERSASLFPSLGNAGPSNVFLNLLTGIALLDGPGTVDCLDRDPYSRESFVRALVEP